MAICTSNAPAANITNKRDICFYNYKAFLSVATIFPPFFQNLTSQLRSLETPQKSLYTEIILLSSGLSMSRTETSFPSEKKFHNKIAIHQCDLIQGHRN